MTPIVEQNLKAEEQSTDLQRLAQDTIDLLIRSRSDMQKYYPRWDANYSAYKNEIEHDESDEKAAERKEPQKLVVPFLFAQTMAFIAFIKTLYNTRETFFELEPIGEEDVKSYELAEQVLDQDLRRNNWNTKLFQVLLDLAITNLGVLQLSWERRTKMVLESVPGATEIVNGIEVETGPTEQPVEKVVYEGNLIRHVSPYRFFPDTRLPLAKYLDGEFCGAYDEFTKSKLRRMEKDGFFVGTKHIPDISSEQLTTFREMRLDMFSSYGSVGASSIDWGTKTHASVVVVHCQRWIIPSEYEIDDEPIGPEDYPVLYDIWIANDKRIIRLSANAQSYDRFSYFIGQYDCSTHELCPDGFAGKIQELQAMASWFLNSHVASVRKVIQNWIIADPTRVEMEDIKRRLPVIRLKQAARSGGIDNAIKQMEVRDVTQTHVADVSLLRELIEYTTGVNENLLGLFSGGRRSAKEAQQTFQSAASRIELAAANIDEQLFRSLGEAMLSNSTEYLTEETLVRISGLEEEHTPDWLNAMMTGGKAIRYEDVVYFKASKEDIQGQFNFRFISTTSPSQKSVAGAMLMEVFDRLSQNPQSALISNLNPGKVIRRAMKLLGMRNLNELQFTPQELIQNASLLQPTGSGTEQPGVGAPAESTPQPLAA